MIVGIEREFGRYGAKLVNRYWAVSALTDAPRELVVSIWQHHIDASDGRWIYDDTLDRWRGAGKNLLKEHLAVALREGLPLRAVVATQHNRAEVLANPEKASRNTFQARPDWVGRVEHLDGDHFVLVFERVGEDAPSVSTGAKYWRAVEAIEALGSASLADVEAWDRSHYPSDPLGNARADLELFTVNSPSRIHYSYSRTNWRSDSGHAHDRLFKVVDPGPPRRTRYVLFNPAEHGHVDLEKVDGKWHVRPLPLDEQARAEAQGHAEAFAHQAPLDSDHDARVWAMRAVAQRRGQPLFRAKLLDAYGGACAITGCTAVEVLEAAHVLPYRGEHTHRVDNGLLLRADLHTLFDCQLLWISPGHTVQVAPALQATDYAALHGQPLRLPASKADHPNPAHLAEHAARCQAREKEKAPA
ncbi:HNH endonuclease [Marilutibacter maris]|nr:HNH endonuclease signature motif containing protein [Lysobacter maris]